MLAKNCTVEQMGTLFPEERLIIWGVGRLFSVFEEGLCSDAIFNAIEYCVDNGYTDHEIVLRGRHIPVFSEKILLEEKNCIILIAVSNGIGEIYDRLCSMELDDSVVCYALPVILSDYAGGASVPQLKNMVLDQTRPPKIEKKIHCFWFSGESKPQEYQKCIDTWEQYCPDYEICEWTTDNYDCTKNQFVKQAIAARKWAFAADYARLDVVYEQGGIYLDMDMELLQSLDGLLGNRAFFGFNFQNYIDLFAFGSEAYNPILKELLDLYEDVDFDDTAMMKFWQPGFVRQTFRQIGLKFNGEMQVIDDMVFLPRNYLSPLDDYNLSRIDKDTIAIHRANIGWQDEQIRKTKVLNAQKIKAIFHSQVMEGNEK